MPKRLLKQSIAQNARYIGPLALSAFWASVAVRVAMDLGLVAAETASTAALSTVAATAFPIAGAAAICFMMADAVRCMFKFEDKKIKCRLSFFRLPYCSEKEYLRSFYNAGAIFLAILGATAVYVGASHIPFTEATTLVQQETVRVLMTAVGAGLLAAIIPTIVAKQFRSGAFAQTFIATAFAAAAVVVMVDIIPDYQTMLFNIISNQAWVDGEKNAAKVSFQILEVVARGLAAAAMTYVGSVFCTTSNYALSKVHCGRKYKYEMLPDYEEQGLVGEAPQRSYGT